MERPSNCIFCKIIEKTQPSSLVYEDELSIAFLDIHPVNEGHVLVVPKRHSSSIIDLPEDEAAHLLKVGSRILKRLRQSGIKCAGANLILSDGPVAGQEVLHTHLHVIPRFQGDGKSFVQSHHTSQVYSRDKLDQIAAKISVRDPQPTSLEQIAQPTIETDRLILQPYKDADAEDVFNYASRSEVTRFLLWETHKTIADSNKFLDWVRSTTCQTRGNLFFVFAMRLKESNRVIGSIDFKNPQPWMGQIDYALHPDHWGKGLMPEAAKAIRDWAFNSFPDFVRLQSFCDPENKGSRRVMEKIGMSFEGIRKKSLRSKGQLIDLAYYALVR